MTLFYSTIIFMTMCFFVYFDYTFSLVRLSLYSSMEPYSAYVVVRYVGGRQCVNVVFIQRLPATAPYIPGYVVDRGCDKPVESFEIHSSSIGLVEPFCQGRYMVLS